MSFRRAILQLHLYLGVAAGLFLVILGLTGAVIAFENDLDHWFHPSSWFVESGDRPLPEQNLIDIVNEKYQPARVVAVQRFRDPKLVRAMRLTGGATVLISPWDGHVTGSFNTPSGVSRVVGYIHQLHTHLVPDPRSARSLADAGEKVVLAAGFLTCLLVPTGVVLWWRAKRASIRVPAPLFRMAFDLHNVTGVWACGFLFLAASTGFMVGQEDTIFKLAGSERPGRMPERTSTPAPGATPVSADRAEQAAMAALQGVTVQALQLPANPRGVFTVVMRFPEDNSETAHSPVLVDQYTGQVLFVRNFLRDSRGFRILRFNRSLHTGDILGGFGHVFVAISSLLTSLMAITGWLIWGTRGRSPSRKPAHSEARSTASV